MSLRRLWPLASLVTAVGCGLLAEGEYAALPTTDGGLKTPPSDLPSADQPVVPDGTSILDAPPDENVIPWDGAPPGDVGDATSPLDGPNLRDGADDHALPSCSRPRLIAPLSNSVTTGSEVRFLFAPTPAVSSYRVRLCTRRGCDGVAPIWSRDVPVTTVTPTVDTVIPMADAVRIVPGVYWWDVSALGPDCAPVHTDPWELRIGVTLPSASGATTWWGAYPDFNSDGYADLAVGAPGSEAEAGAVIVYHGARDVLYAAPHTTLTHRASRFGTAITSAGDLDGDGYGDLATVAESEVLVFRGSASGLLSDAPVVVSLPSNAIDALVVGVGDVNGDGYGDLLARARIANTFHVYFAGGGPHTPRFEEIPHPNASSPMRCPHFGAAIAPAGDVNGDGFADLVIGCPAQFSSELSPTISPRVYVLLGGPTFNPASSPALAVAPPPLSGPTFGHLVAGVGNVTGTRRAVIAVGHSNTVRLFEFTAGSSPTATAVTIPWSLQNLLNSFQSLTALAGIGDVDRDGIGDYAMAFDAPLLPPQVLLVPSRRSPVRVLVGSPPFRQEIALAGAGDANADGFDDLAVGFQPLTERRLVRVFRGAMSFPDSLDDMSSTLSSPTTASSFGVSLANGR